MSQINFSEASSFGFSLIFGLIWLFWLFYMFWCMYKLGRTAWSAGPEAFGSFWGCAIYFGLLWLFLLILALSFLWAGIKRVKVNHPYSQMNYPHFPDENILKVYNAFASTQHCVYSGYYYSYEDGDKSEGR